MHGQPGTPMLVPSSQFPNPPPGYQYISPNSPMSQVSSIAPLLQVTSNEEASEVSGHGRGRGRGKSGRGRGAGARKGSKKAKEPTALVPWDLDAPPGGKSSLERIVNWLSVHKNYITWRGPSQTKKSQAEAIAEWLETEGCAGRNGKGVEQQHWPRYHGQHLERDEDQDKNAIDHVGAANSEIEAEVWAKCPFYDALEPVMANRPSAAPPHLSEQTEQDVNTDIARALGFEHGEEPTETPNTNDKPAGNTNDRPACRESPDWDNDPSLWDTQDFKAPDPILQSGVDSPQPSQSQRLSNVISTATTRINSSTTVAAQKRALESVTLASPRKKSHAETITNQIFPSKEEMDADEAQQLALLHYLARENIKLDLEVAQAKAEVAQAKAEVARAKAEVEEKESATKNSNALMRANMIQGFMQNTGFTYENVVKATNNVMGMPVLAQALAGPQAENKDL
ncbi:hypothetical protein PSHT_13912 [Puccinia striiformis]|uniref:Uncharacterized protein n=1 Tax=Puccinia striiformis TaxID=27350 RepID=A0A2S4UNJ4_9BASI|nr:hypothetical protein PSHT_13912 [Puccinia striiformis]